MYKIGELSKLSNLPIKTLRYYDSEGLLSPDYIDAFTGYRYYSAAKLSDCYRIITLKELGFSLSEIKDCLSLPKEKFSELLKEKEQELEKLKLQTEKRIQVLRDLNSALKENTTMFDIVIRTSDEIRFAYHRELISDKAMYPAVIDSMRHAIPERIQGSRTLFIDYETTCISENFDTGFGVEITASLPKNCAYEEKLLSFSSDTASVICTETDYETAVTTLQRYVLDNSYQIVGPLYKIVYPDGTIELKLPIVKLDSSKALSNEEVMLPFENDPEVIGHWELYDLLPCKEMFHPQKQKTTITDEKIKELYFLPGGERYWCFSWTKGLLLSTTGYPHNRRQNKYTIEIHDNQPFLFVEFKGKEYSEGGKPELWVFKKTDSKEYTKQDIIIKDEIPDAPANDASVLGTWNVCAFVKQAEDFQPDTNCSLIPYEGLFWRTAEFLVDGKIQNSFKNSDTGIISTDDPAVWRWVNGYVICNTRPLASKYVIKKIDDVDYLFIQWKSGDYYFGGREPSWYVFKR